MVEVGEGDAGVTVAGSTVGAGGAGVSLGDDVGDDVGTAVGGCDGEAVGKGRLALPVLGTLALGLAAGAAHAATRAATRSATIRFRWNISGPQDGFIHAQDGRPGLHGHLPPVMKCRPDRPDSGAEPGQSSGVSRAIGMIRSVFDG